MFKRVAYSLFILPLLGYALFGLIKPSLAKADVASCQASLVAHAVSPNSQNTFNMHITNTGINAINGVRVSRPSANFTILGNSAPGWSDSTAAEYADESSGSLAAGDSMDVSVTVQSANVQAGTANWIVSAADTDFNNFSCGGNLGMAITGDLSDLTPPSVYNVTVSDITTSSANITWSTDEASDSMVNYGQTDSYGNSTDVNSDMVTDHSVSLSGLLPNTGYHYQVVSADAAGNSTGSPDNTFLSAANQTHIAGAGPQPSSPPIGLVITNPGDKNPPSVNLNPANQIYKTTPTLSGIAADDIAVARVEYSVDNGKNWLATETITGLGTKNVSFSFTPANLDDGNYKVLARAIDAGGNITSTAPLSIVVDRLPPIVGGNVLALGPQILNAGQSGEILTSIGADERITLSAVGGPTAIAISAAGNNLSGAKSFALTKSADSGLWSGVVSFGKAGSYQLAANAIDGAGNKTSKKLSVIQVAEPARVLASDGRPISATVTAYYLEPWTNTWVAWDGGAYGQVNPQLTGKDGTFNLFLPAGTYYLTAKAAGYATVTSSIFKLNAPSPVITTLKASKTSWPLHIGGLDFSAQRIDIKTGPADQPANNKNSLVGKQIPDFKLSDTGGQTINATDLLGKPTLLSFMSTWSPSASEQLPSLAKLASNHDLNIEPVALQQSAAQIRVYQSLSGYSLDWLADPDGQTSDTFKVSGLPTHYFIDRNGVIKQIVTGVLTKQELLKNLSDL